MSGFNLDDYVDVAERIRLFYARYPDGRLRTVEHGKYEIDGRTFVWCKAYAYRSEEDKWPCSGTAWEPIPGLTPYTKDSELMNAETAAWGRAIIAAGIPSKKIASAEEVRNRQSTDNGGGSKKTKPELLAHLGDLLASLSVADKTIDWSESAKNISGKFFDGERDFTKLNKGNLESLVAEVERWLVTAKPREPEEVPFS